MNKKNYRVGEIKNILEKIYNDPEQRRKTVPTFVSNTGMGKSFIIKEFMEEKGVYKPPFVLSQRMPFEVSGMALVDREKDIMKYYDFDFLLSLKDGDILFIDETFNANPLTLSAFLTFLESRIMISGRKLPDIMIIAAANPQGMPVLTPQILRRFLRYDVIFDKVSWSEYMFKKYKLPGSIAEKLCNLIGNEKFDGYNFNTPADLDDAVDMIIKDIPTPYDVDIKPILDSLISLEDSDLMVNLKENLKKKGLSESEILTTLANGIEISKDYTLYLNEKISWLKLKQLENGRITNK